MDATYQYDALTRRIVTEAAAETRHFYFNSQWRAIEERVSGAVKAQYVWNPADRWDLIRRKRSTTDTPDEIRFVLRDYLDPAAIINESGTVTERYRYDAFGPVTVLAPDFSVRANSECGWNFLYHAEFIDALTGLYNYGYRYYHPDLGRWISRDPIGEDGGLNLYGFVGNDSTNITDYVGREPTSNTGEIVLKLKPLSLKIGKCGAVRWDAEFVVEGAPPGFNGWIMQKIRNKSVVLPCGGDKGHVELPDKAATELDVPPGSTAYNADIFTAYEAWKFGGSQKDSWYTGDQTKTAKGKKCKGHYTIVGTAAVVNKGMGNFIQAPNPPTPPEKPDEFAPFVDKKHPLFPADFVLPRIHNTNFIRPISLSNELTRALEVKWDCCHGPSDSIVKIDGKEATGY